MSVLDDVLLRYNRAYISAARNGIATPDMVYEDADYHVVVGRKDHTNTLTLNITVKATNERLTASVKDGMI